MLKRGQAGKCFGHWTVPGGKSEVGENFFVTAQREAEEETGSLPENVVIGDFENREGKFVFKTFVSCIEKRFVVKLSEEHTDSAWIELEDLKNYKLHPKLVEILPYVVSLIKEKIPQ